MLGVFPFRIIDGTLYVDGGVTGNILYGGRGDEDDKLRGMWQKAYPNSADSENPHVDHFQ